MSDQEKVTVEYYNRGSRRKPNYWVRFRTRGKQYREPTGLKTEADAKSFSSALERKIRRGEWTPAPRGEKKKPLGTTFGTFAPTGLAQRIGMGVKTAAKDERGHLENHLVPEFGQCSFEDLTHQRICTGFAVIAGKGLSGSSMRNIHNTFHAILRLAGKAGHLHTVPARLRVIDNDLPPVVDTRPEGWRDAAWFHADEVLDLVGCEAIEVQYRVMHITWFMCGGRFSEVTPLLVRSWDPDRNPLGAMTLRAVKLRRDKGPMYRIVPVHPEYAAWLSWWLREGFELNHGRPPRPDDLLFPTLSTRRKNAAKRAGVDPLSVACSHGEIYKRWQRHHLPAAGLAHRRIHDTRRTFISKLRNAPGSDDKLVRCFTHRATADKVLDSYTHREWEALCRQLTDVNWRLPLPPGTEAQVVHLRPRTGRLASSGDEG